MAVPRVQMPDAWTQLRYHPLQQKLWTSRARFVAVAAGRGSGKTEIARRKIVRVMADKKPWPDPMYFYALPTYEQAERVAWGNILRLFPEKWIDDVNRTKLRIKTVFGSTLYVVGLDRPKRVEGVQWDGCVIDESSDQHPGSFGLSVLPALSHRNGWCWRIGVPKRVGVGAGEFKEFFFNKADESYTWPSEDILTPDQLKYAKEALDEKDYREQYLASWESSSGAIFHAWSNENINDAIQYQPDKPIIVGADFNVDPMAWIIGQMHGGRLHVFDELWVRGTYTQQCLDILWGRYAEHKAGWHFFGDATAQSRNTRASESDYIQIKNDTRFINATCHYPRKNPRVSNRFASCNAAFKNAEGVRRVLVNPRCKNLIKDLEQRAYKPGTSEADDSGDVGHITDALGYVIYARFPIMIVTNPVGQVHVSMGQQ